MNKHIRDAKRIEEALIQAHRQPSQTEVGSYFEQKVMARILDEVPPAAAPVTSWWTANRLVWSAVVVSFLVVIVLAAHVMTDDISGQYQIASFMMGDSNSLDLARSFGAL